MATRTFKLAGTTEGSSTITVNFNGTQVFTGAVGTDGDLCSFTADDSISGIIATTVTVNSGDTVVVQGLKANFSNYILEPGVDNGDGTTTPPVSTINDADNFYYMIGTDGEYASKTSSANALVDGESLEHDDSDKGGNWWYFLDNGQTLSVDYNVTA